MQQGSYKPTEKKPQKTKKQLHVLESLPIKREQTAINEIHLTMPLNSKFTLTCKSIPQP